MANGPRRNIVIFITSGTVIERREEMNQKIYVTARFRAREDKRTDVGRRNLT